MDLAFVIPTRNRTQCLAATLDHLGALEPRLKAEIVVADNASSESIETPSHLANGWPVRLIRLDRHRGAGARNVAAARTDAPWLCMLDDDSYPIHAGLFDALLTADGSTFAVGARIRLLNGEHERGGLPEVFVGCGVLLRREPFLRLGGYDESFDYYVEEYDLCARAIAAGWRIVHDDRFEVRHEKVSAGRDLTRIIRLLVRNNGWTFHRYAPAGELASAMSDMFARYHEIAIRERVLPAYEAGLRELEATIERQPRRPLSLECWDRFTGLAAVRAHLPAALVALDLRRVAVEGRDKHAQLIDRALDEVGVSPIDVADADAVIAGTLAPGPMRDLAERLTRRHPRHVVLTPWVPGGATLVPPRLAFAAR